MSNPIFSNEISDSEDGKRRQVDNADSINRIKEALAGREGKWLAQAAGLPPSSISDYLNGRLPRIDAALKLARALEVDAEWLFGDQVERKELHEIPGHLHDIETGFRGFPSDSATQDTVQLPEIDIGFSMGHGLIIADHADAKTVSLPRDWLRSLIKGTFRDVFIARGEGDSMMPTLLNGDIVAIDTAQNALTGQDMLWCCTYGDLGMIKRLRSMPDGGILVSSDNEVVAKPYMTYDGELHIIGRVIWIGRRV